MAEPQTTTDPTWKSDRAHEAICEAAERIANYYCSEDDTYSLEVKRLTVAISDVVDSRSPAPIAPVVDKQKVEQDASFEYCPACAGELDTGYECLKCGRDWWPWAAFAPDSIRDEGYGWCVWRFEAGVWQTDCGDQFMLDDGTPKENEMAYCCFCGGVLGEVDNER